MGEHWSREALDLCAPNPGADPFLAERRFLHAILEQAVFDLQLPRARLRAGRRFATVKDARRHETRVRRQGGCDPCALARIDADAYESAFRFWFGADENAAALCTMLGLDLDALRDGLRRRMVAQIGAADFLADLTRLVTGEPERPAA